MEGGTPVAQEQRGGRRWTPVYWLHSDPVADGLDRLSNLQLGGAAASLVERDHEYRLVYDAHQGMWRLDRRRFVPGG